MRGEDRAFLIGDDLLAVPKWAEQPRLPKGLWRTVSLVGENAGADRYQSDLKVRSGAIIPLGQVVQSTVEESLDSLTLVISLDEQGRASGRLYEDDGDGYAYQDGNYLLTTYEAVRKGDAVIVTIAHAEGKRPRPDRRVVVQLLIESGRIEAEGVDGQPITVRIAR